MSQELFIIAEIVRPHGRRGEVLLRPRTDRLETIAGATSVYLGIDAIRPVGVENTRMHKGSFLLKLDGVNDISTAASLKGVPVCMPREELAPLDEGEYFLHDLTGLDVMDHNGRKVGRTEWVMETGGPAVLVGTSTDNREFMIPFSAGTVQDVDLERKILRLKNLPGLLDSAGE